MLGFGKTVQRLLRIVRGLELRQLHVVNRARADRDPENQAAAVLRLLEQCREFFLPDELGSKKILRDQEDGDAGGFDGQLEGRAC